MQSKDVRCRLIRRALSFLLGMAALGPSAAFAGDVEYLKLDELLRSEDVQEILQAPVTLYWGDQPTPAFVEMAAMDTHSRTSISRSPFGGSRRHCVEAFEMALKATVDDAVKAGYDSIVGIRIFVEGKRAESPVGFYCKPGYKTTTIMLESAYALTSAGAQRIAAEESFIPEGPPRPPADGAIYLPLAPILESAEAQTILGSDISVYRQNPAPDYSDRYGPEVWYDYGEVGRYGKEGACKQAALKILVALADDARARGFDSIMKLRSYLNEQFTPDAADLECEIGRRNALVKLRAMLAKRKT